MTVLASAPIAPIDLAALPPAPTAHTCFPNRVECDTCLNLIAAEIAAQLHFNHSQAALLAPVWYRAQIGEDHCSIDRARVLRFAAMRLCAEQQPVPGVEPRVMADWRISSPFSLVEPEDDGINFFRGFFNGLLLVLTCAAISCLIAYLLYKPEVF